VEYLSYLDSVITSEARYIHKVKSRIAVAKAAFSKKEDAFTGKLVCKCKEETS